MKTVSSACCCAVMVWLATVTCSQLAVAGAVDPMFAITARGAGVQKAISANVEEHGALVQSSDVAATQAFLESHDALVGSVVGDILSVHLPLQLLEALAARPEVHYVEAAKPLQMKLDEALEEVGAEQVHLGENVPQAYTGTGVIVGVVDTGIDWKHPALRGRVLALWDQNIAADDYWKSPVEVDESYGVECLPVHFVGDHCPSQDYIGHGTAVAGIAASSNGKYAGVAPGAEIIAVKLGGADNSLYGMSYVPSGDSMVIWSHVVVDAVSYIFRKAEAMGRPAVVNLSMGAHYGAHDGSSLLERALDMLVAEAPGRSIVVSAGNDNSDLSSYLAGPHAGGTLQSEGRAHEFVSYSAHEYGIVLDLWLPKDSAVTFAVGIDNYEQYEKSPFVSAGEVQAFTTADGALTVTIDASEGEHPLNGDQHVMISIVPSEGVDGRAPNFAEYTFDLLARGTGRYDAWVASQGRFTRRNEHVRGLDHRYVPGTRQYSVGIPSTAAQVISVAAYVNRIEIAQLSTSGNVDLDVPAREGVLAPYSSFGPSRSPEYTGQKPDIAAPGHWVIAPVSQQSVNATGHLNLPKTSSALYGLHSGTSMSAPMVAGAIALLYEHDPLLTVAQVKRVIARSARTDKSVDLVPSNQWGFGKLDIAAALQQIETIDRETPLPFAEAGDEPAFESSVTASASAPSGGCQLVRGAGTQLPIIATLSLLILLMAVRLGGVPRIVLWSCVVLLLSGCNAYPSYNFADGLPGTSQSDEPPGEQQRVVFDDEAYLVTYLRANFAEQSAVVLEIPYAAYQAGNELTLSANGMRGDEKETARLSIFHFRDQELKELERAEVARRGTVEIDSASLSSRSVFSGRIYGAKLHAYDVEHQMFERGVGSRFYGGDFYVGNSSWVDPPPLIWEVFPRVVSRGETVTMRGVNLAQESVYLCALGIQCTELIVPEVQADTRIEFVVPPDAPEQAWVSLQSDGGYRTQHRIHVLDGKRYVRLLEKNPRVVQWHEATQTMHVVNHDATHVSHVDYPRRAIIQHWSIPHGVERLGKVAMATDGATIAFCDLESGLLHVWQLEGGLTWTDSAVWLPETRCDELAFISEAQLMTVYQGKGLNGELRYAMIDLPEQSITSGILIDSVPDQPESLHVHEGSPYLAVSWGGSWAHVAIVSIIDQIPVLEAHIKTHEKFQYVDWAAQRLAFSQSDYAFVGEPYAETDGWRDCRRHAVLSVNDAELCERVDGSLDVLSGAGEVVLSDIRLLPEGYTLKSWHYNAQEHSLIALSERTMFFINADELAIIIGQGSDES